MKTPNNKLNPHIASTPGFDKKFFIISSDIYILIEITTTTSNYHSFCYTYTILSRQH